METTQKMHIEIRAVLSKGPSLLLEKLSIISMRSGGKSECVPARCINVPGRIRRRSLVLDGASSKKPLNSC